MCHKSEEQLTKLFQAAQKDTLRIKRCIKDVCINCNFCKRGRKTSTRLRAALLIQIEYPEDNDKKDAIMPENDTEEMSKERKNADEEDIAIRKH